MILRTGRKARRERKKKARDPMLDEEIALVEAATADLDSDTRRDDRRDDTRQAVDRIVEQAMQQQDTTVERKRD